MPGMLDGLAWTAPAVYEDPLDRAVLRQPEAGATGAATSWMLTAHIPNVRADEKYDYQAGNQPLLDPGVPLAAFVADPNSWSSTPAQPQGSEVREQERNMIAAIQSMGIGIP